MGTLGVLPRLLGAVLRIVRAHSVEQLLSQLVVGWVLHNEREDERPFQVPLRIVEPIVEFEPFPVLGHTLKRHRRCLRETSASRTRRRSDSCLNSCVSRTVLRAALAATAANTKPIAEMMTVAIAAASKPPLTIGACADAPALVADVDRQRDEREPSAATGRGLYGLAVSRPARGNGVEPHPHCRYRRPEDSAHAQTTAS